MCFSVTSEGFNMIDSILLTSPADYPLVVDCIKDYVKGEGGAYNILVADRAVNCLESRYPIRATRHPKYPHLVNLDYTHEAYNPVLSELSYCDLVNECRGLMLNLEYLTVVARGFDRFHNLNQFPSNQGFNFNCYSIYEKLDGSLIELYHYDGQWLMKTRGTTTADGNTNGYTFEELARGYITDRWDLSKLDTAYTYCCELTSPYNRVVVEYPETKVTLLGVREAATGKYYPLEYVDGIPKEDINFPIEVGCSYTPEELIARVEALDPAKSEGIVIQDTKGVRLKVKNSQWCKLNKALFAMKPIELLERYVKGDGEVVDLINFLPGMRQFVERAVTDYSAVRSECSNIWQTVDSIIATQITYNSLDSRERLTETEYRKEFARILLDKSSYIDEVSYQFVIKYQKMIFAIFKSGLTYDEREKFMVDMYIGILKKDKKKLTKLLTNI